MNTIWNLPKLTHCSFNIDFESQLYFPVPTMTSSTLEYLSILGMEPSRSNIDCLLQHTPHLRYFSTHIQKISGFNHQLSSISSITTLNLSLCLVWYNMFEQFFQWVLNVCHLKVELKDTYLDGQKWEEIIRVRLINVKKLKFRMKFHTKKYNSNNEEQVDEVLDSFRTRFWLDEHRWFVQCDWSPHTQDAYVYTLPLAFSDFEFVFPIISKSTCPANHDRWSYDSVRRLNYKAGLNQCLSESYIQFFNIQDLSMKLPVYQYF